VDEARFRFQLRKEEWDEYERGNEWFTFDIEALDRDMTTDEVIELEAALGFSLDQIVTGLLHGGARAKLWAFWIARKQAGIKEDLEFFKPRVRAAAVFPLIDEGDAVPPDHAASAEPPPSS